MESIDRRRFMHKAGLATAVTGAVWATPSIIGSSAAFAAGSVCGPRTLNWTDFPVGNVFNSAVVGGLTVAVTTSLFSWPGATRSSSPKALNRTIQATPHGGISGSSLRIDQTPVTLSGQEITFGFSAPVKNVSFTITDIDTSTGNWSDRVSIVTTPFTWNSRGSNLRGIGQNISSIDDNSNGPFRPISAGNIGDGDGSGNAKVTVPGPVTSFRVRFWCGSEASATSNQRINISNITFNTCP